MYKGRNITTTRESQSIGNNSPAIIRQWAHLPRSQNFRKCVDARIPVGSIYITKANKDSKNLFISHDQSMATGRSERPLQEPNQGHLHWLKLSLHPEALSKRLWVSRTESDVTMAEGIIHMSVSAERYLQDRTYPRHRHSKRVSNGSLQAYYVLRCWLYSMSG